MLNLLQQNDKVKIYTDFIVGISGKDKVKNTTQNIAEMLVIFIAKVKCKYG